ncbi:MAG TPA: hypothetical protein VGF45_17000 [Polyangia bacterium]
MRPAWRALIVGAALFGAKAASAAPTLTCRVERAGERSLVIGRLEDLFDRELLRLVELGLPGRLHAEAKLYRPRGLWFDARIADTKQVFIVTWSKERSEFRLDGRRLPSAQRFELPVIALRPEEPGGSYVELTVRLEIITARSLGQVASWLVTGQTAAAGQEDDAESKGKTAGAANPTPLPRALVDYLAADLIRTTESKCPVGK